MEVSGQGYPDLPVGKTMHEMLLLTSQMIIKRTRQINQGDHFGIVGPRPEFNLLRYLWELIQRLFTGIDLNVEYRYIWITDAYRRTEYMLSSDGKQYRVYQPADSFGFVGSHIGTVQEWKEALLPVAGQEGRLSRGAQAGSYALTVPDGGVSNIVARLESVPQKGGCLGLIFALVFAIWDAIKKLLGLT